MKQRILTLTRTISAFAIILCLTTSCSEPEEAPDYLGQLEGNWVGEKGDSSLGIPYASFFEDDTYILSGTKSPIKMPRMPWRKTGDNEIALKVMAGKGQTFETYYSIHI